jgi:hypothetical protein
MTRCCIQKLCLKRRGTTALSTNIHTPSIHMGRFVSVGFNNAYPPGMATRSHSSLTQSPMNRSATNLTPREHVTCIKRGGSVNDACWRCSLVLSPHGSLKAAERDASITLLRR